MLKINQTIIRTSRVLYCTKVPSKSSPYTHTVLLPKTNVPFRLDEQSLLERDKDIYKVLSNFEKLDINYS